MEIEQSSAASVSAPTPASEQSYLLAGRASGLESSNNATHGNSSKCCSLSNILLVSGYIILMALSISGFLYLKHQNEATAVLLQESISSFNERINSFNAHYEQQLTTVTTKQGDFEIDTSSKFEETSHVIDSLSDLISATNSTLNNQFSKIFE
eukprot:gene13529-17971_t